MATIDDPSFTNSWYDEMLPTWQFLSDLLAGQDTIKQHSRPGNNRAVGHWGKASYLPQEPAELLEDYWRRSDRSLFFEDYRDCVVNLTGMVFRKPPSLCDDVPALISGVEAVIDENGVVTTPAIEGLAENIDYAGAHLNVFLQRVFEDGFFGHSFIVVEMPASDGNIQTAADERAAGLRSYWCMRQAKDALNWRTAAVNGQTVLTQITFKEMATEAKGMFGEQKVTRYRVYRLDENGNAEWQLWEEEKNSKGEVDVVFKASGLILTKKGLPLKRLPIAVHYGEYAGLLQSRPPLKGIADLNIAYYQKYSDLSNIEHHTCAVTLCIMGVDDQSANKTLGGNCVIYLPTGADAKFLEVNGDSIPALERDLEMLQKRLVAKGLDFVQDQHRVPTTATEVMLAYTQRTSKLARMVRSLIDCTETALSITAEMEGLPEGGSVTLGVDESSLTLTPIEMRVFSEMNERGQMSLQTLWGIMDRADMLPDDFDPIAEEKSLLEAAARQMEINAKQFDAGFESTP